MHSRPGALSNSVSPLLECDTPDLGREKRILQVNPMSPPTQNAGASSCLKSVPALTVRVALIVPQSALRISTRSAVEFRIEDTDH